MSLKRAYLGPGALDSLREGRAAALGCDELYIGLGLALTSGDRALVRRALAELPPDRIERDSVLLGFRDVLRDGRRR
jgi:hypothetical protein